MLTFAALPQRAAYSVAHRGLRPLCATVHHTRRDAHARMHRLADTYESLAEKLGTLALDWHRGTMPRAVLAQHAAAALDPAHHGADDKPDDALDAAHALLEAIAHHEAHVAEVLSPRECGIPSVLMRVWPVPGAYPVLAYIVTRAVSTHWRTLVAQARDAGATLRGLVIDWVWEPSMRLLDTLRAGRAERRLIVSRDSLVADEQSLARMVRAFGEDQLHLRGAELDASLARAQNGDLTDVMEHYERDIRAPLRSLLVGGSLIRTVLIQVQKAKVDLEVALNGIDWLLHSQELLIGFAGLAPALVLVYALWRVAARATHALVYGRAAGQAQRSTQEARLEAWEALRQIDALVSEAPRSEARAPAYGHLLLNIDVLRAAFAQLLPATTRKRAVGTCLNDEIERDLCALELAGQSAVFAGNDTAWQRRQATIERMWRSWSWLLAMNRLVP